MYVHLQPGRSEEFLLSCGLSFRSRNRHPYHLQALPRPVQHQPGRSEEFLLSCGLIFPASYSATQNVMLQNHQPFQEIKKSEKVAYISSVKKVLIWSQDYSQNYNHNTTIFVLLTTCSKFKYHQKSSHFHTSQTDLTSSYHQCLPSLIKEASIPANSSGGHKIQWIQEL